MKLNDKQRAIMAAILGISNLGMDNTFLGPCAIVKPNDAVAFYRQPCYGTDLVESAVYFLGASFFESEDMAAMFVDEARSWHEQIDTVKKARGHRYDHFLDALLLETYNEEVMCDA